MYFTDTPKLRKFEREMQQKPNFDRRKDNCDENDIVDSHNDRKSTTNSKYKDGG